jgi:hypothetical protein
MKQCAPFVAVIACPRKGHVGSENAIHAVAPLDIRHPEETHAEKCGQHQQHRAQRHFQSDQPFARPLPAAAFRGRPGSGSKSVGRLYARCPDGWPQSAEQTAARRHAERE